MVKCPKCGKEIRYIPLTGRVDSPAMAIVDATYTELINDNGRVIKGHTRHICDSGYERYHDFNPGAGKKEQGNEGA